MEYSENFLGIGKAARQRKKERRTFRKEKRQLRLEKKKSKIQDRRSEAGLKEAQAIALENISSEPKSDTVGKTKNKNTLMIIGIIAGVVVLVLIAVAIAFKKKSN